MVTASIVLYNTSEKHLQKVITCVANSVVSTIYIIDNNTSDSNKALVESLSEKIVYIQGQGNVGYGAAHNIALRKTIKQGTKYHFALNPDIEFDEGTLEKLVGFMDEHPNVGLVMPKVLYPNGKLQYLCKLLPTPVDLIARRFLSSSYKKRGHSKKYELWSMDYSTVCFDIPVLSGCFLMLRVDVLKNTGLFDERFFLYMEDVDLSRRLQDFAQTAFFPDATIVHYHERGSYKNRRLLKYHISSAVKYFNKWGWLFDRNRVKINKRVLGKIQ